VLAIITTLFLPPTLITGIFRHEYQGIAVHRDGRSLPVGGRGSWSPRRSPVYWLDTADRRFSSYDRRVTILGRLLRATCGFVFSVVGLALIAGLGGSAGIGRGDRWLHRHLAPDHAQGVHRLAQLARRQGTGVSTPPMWATRSANVSGGIRRGVTYGGRLDLGVDADFRESWWVGPAPKGRTPNMFQIHGPRG